MKILIRADATPTMGTGHVMRCLALAQAANESGADVVMCCRIEVPWVAERMKKEGIPFRCLSSPCNPDENPDEILSIVREHEPDYVTFDGYHFGLECQKAVRNAGYGLLVIDDYAHLPEYSADILLNQNMGAEMLGYNGDIKKKLLDPGYALLRAEYRRARPLAQKRVLPNRPRNILVSLGGGDFSRHLDEIAPVLSLPELKGIRLRILAGGTPPEYIGKRLADIPAVLEILQRVDDMPGVLLDTDLCITAGGSTCWELCCMGVPFLTVEIAENQKEMLSAMDCRNIAKPLSSTALLDMIENKASRLTATETIMPLVTANGTATVISLMAR